MDDAVLYEYGAALGRLHSLSQRFTPPVRKSSYREALEVMRREFAAGDVPESVRRELTAVSNLLNSLPRTEDYFGLVHYDFEPDNVFWNVKNHQCSVIDFDDGMYHWFALDVEQVFDCLTEFFEGDALQKAKKQFLKGYRTHHAFTEEMEASMPLMRRFINLYSYARLRHCLSEPVSAKPEWMMRLETRLRSKLHYLESTMDC